MIRNTLIYLAVWLLALIALVAQSAWGTNISWLQAMILVARDWLPWVVLGPPLWWLVKRFPLFGEKKWRHFGIHFLVSIFMVVLAETMVALIIYPATQPAMEKATLSERDLMREIRGVRPRPLLRRAEYRLRTRTLVRKAPSWFLLNWVFVLIGTSVLQRRDAEERARRALALKNDLAQARLRELQSRLQPHFLFNALNSIAALIQIDPDKADKMLGQLSSLLRKVLDSGEKPLIPLRDELSLLRDYLAIEQVRFSDRLTVVESIDEQTLSLLVPPLILQPIAENAVKHGIEPKSSPSTLRIVSKLENDLILEIIDDGVGQDSPKESEGFGIGMENVTDRLENAYPGKTSLSVEFPDEGGTKVQLKMPAKNS